MSEATPEKKKIISRQKIVDALRIYRFILPYKWHFIVGMICLVVSTGVVSFIPGGFGQLVDAASPGKAIIGQISDVLKTTASQDEKISRITELVSKYSSEIDPEKLKEIGLILGIVLLIQAVLSFFRIYLFEYVSQQAMSAIRRALYEKIITLPIQFFEENRVGNLTSRISSDVTQLQEAFTNQLAFFVRQLVLPIVCIPFILAVSVKLTLIILALLPVLIVAAVLFGRFIRKISRKA
ncbi:MAG: ABC transporter transmembrane domain-containing protein, partial [Bacteroidota bacterium]